MNITYTHVLQDKENAGGSEGILPAKKKDREERKKLAAAKNAAALEEAKLATVLLQC